MATNDSIDLVNYLECIRCGDVKMLIEREKCKQFVPFSMGFAQEAAFCGYCGCLRNYHRKVVVQPPSPPLPPPPPGSDVIVIDDDTSEEELLEKPAKKRTKLSVEQKQKMKEYAEKVAWRPNYKENNHEIIDLCTEIGVTRTVFVTWIRNNRCRLRIGQSSMA